MKQKRKVLSTAIGLFITLGIIVIIGHTIVCASTERFEEPVFSSMVLTPGLYTQKELSSDYKAPSSVRSESDFAFYYQTASYSYGITPSGYEIISFVNPDGSVVDALNGGGTFQITNRSARYLTSSSFHVKNYKLQSENKLIVYYDAKGGEQYTEYTFTPNSIKVTANVKFSTQESNLNTIVLKRNFINNYIDHEKKVSSNWVFPKTKDFPYRTFDGYVLTNYVDSSHKLYSFWMEPAANPAIIPDYLPTGDLMVTTVPSSLSSYTLSYALVFENLSSGYDSDYYALFKGRSSDLAIGITPSVRPQSSATLFDTKDISFNLNITNLSDTAVEYKVKYSIYDYYGNIYNNTKDSLKLAAGSQTNYLLKPTTDKNGIYYICTTVSYQGKEYHEIYPFILYEPHKYEYVSTSPFGVSGIRFGQYSPNNTLVHLAKEMGIANMRICFSLPDYIGTDYTLLQSYLAQLHDNGTKITGQYLLSSDWTIPNTGTRYATELDNALNYIGDYLTDCEIGNENNYTTSGMGIAMTNYLNKQFNPTYDIVTNQHKLPIIGSGVYLSKTDWLDAALASGLWNRTSVLSTHAYSFPHRPDLTNNPEIEHSYESALVRIRNFMDKHGEKTWYMSEFGYHTTPGKSSGLFSGSDLRSQADYTIREYILGLAYGVDVLEAYAFIDGTNTSKAMSDTQIECHYGMFYAEDYYGRLMPKPLVMSYITMTQELDGYSKCSEVSDKSPTTRLFEINLQQTNEPLYICWSNCSPLSTDTSYSRTKGLPWINQWKNSETIAFYTNNYVSATDFQGNTTTYYPKNGMVTIPVTGEPVIIKHASLVPVK